MRKPIYPIENEIGKKYYYLTVLGESDYYYNKTKRTRKWLFKCDCGKVISIVPYYVTHGKQFSCGCKKGFLAGQANKERSLDLTRTPEENRLFSTYRLDAKKDDREFSISLETFIKLVNSKCYYCDLEPFTVRRSSNKERFKCLNGIDRLDSNIGYTEENVVPCCIHCNKAKSARTYEDFKNWIKLVYKNLFGI